MPMSIMRCELHQKRWDSDKEECCLRCLEEESLDNDANREMGLPEGVDWGNK